MSNFGSFNNKYIKVRIPNYVKRLIFISTLLIAAIYLSQTTLEFIKKADYSGLLGEIIGGLTTTVLLIFLGALFRPVIEISPKISMEKTEDGNEFILKMYNSGFLSIYDVRASLTKVTYTRTHLGKTNSVLQGIPITFSYIEVVPPWTSPKAWKQGREFAIQFKIKEHQQGDNKGEIEDVKKILSNKEDTTHYRLTISCTSGLSGLKHLKSENYTYKSSVVDGEFKSGATFVIK